MPIVGEVLLLAPALKLFLSSSFSVYLNILSWGLLALPFYTYFVIKFSLLFVSFIDVIKKKKHQGLVKLELGILGPQCPAMSRQHSFTYSMLCDHQRGVSTSGHWDQTDSSEFYGNF